MVKVEVIKDFYLSMSKFETLKNIQRINLKDDGHLYKKDKFECTEEMAKYLMETNDETKKTGESFVIIVGGVPEKQKEDIVEEVEKPKRTTRRKKSVAKK